MLYVLDIGVGRGLPAVTLLSQQRVATWQKEVSAIKKAAPLPLRGLGLKTAHANTHTHTYIGTQTPPFNCIYMCVCVE